MSSLPCTIAPGGICGVATGLVSITLTETRKERGTEKGEAHFPRRKSIKNPRLWLKMKWYDRIHWISSEFKS